MWIFTVAPDWLIHLITAAGIIGIIGGFLLGFIPFISKYKLPIQIISVLVFAFGVYLEGGLADNIEWQLRVKEMEAKVAQAEAKAATKNVEIQEKIVTKTEVVVEKGRDIIKYVDKIVTKEVLKEVPGPERERMVEVIKYIESCPVPQELIDQHNAAALIGAHNKAAQRPETKK